MQWIKGKHYHLPTDEGEEVFRTKKEAAAFLAETMEPWKVKVILADIKPCVKVCEVVWPAGGGDD